MGTRARHALTQLVMLADGRSAQPFFWIEDYDWSGFRPSEGPIFATFRDVEELARAKLIEAHFSDDLDAASVTLTEKAVRAVPGGFGMDDRRRLLESMYLLARGCSQQYVQIERLARYESMSLTDVQRLLWLMAEKGLVRELSDADQQLLAQHEPEPSFFLTETGLREVMDEPMPSKTDQPSPSISITNHGPVGALTLGDHNNTKVTQQVGATVAEIAELIDCCRKRLGELPPERRQEAEDALDALGDQVKSNGGSPITVKCIFRTLAAVAVKGTDLADRILKLAQALGLDPRTIASHLVHHGQ